jgi:hypothetical protein
MSSIIRDRTGASIRPSVSSVSSVQSVSSAVGVVRVVRVVRHGEDFLYKPIKGAPSARQAAGRAHAETGAEDAMCRGVGA